jgi:pyruvate/2-oxoglutarate dehydrogenase complex dihydrolipoamide acyltransferase (E2) component
MTDFKLPAFDDNTTTATVVMWRKAVGETLAPGEVLLEVVTEKINIEVECPLAGRLVEHVASVDEEVKVGAVLARIETP